VQAAFVAIAHKALDRDVQSILISGIFGGWLIALMVWLLPFAESSRLWVIILITYIVGLGHFSHIIAGAIEMFVLAMSGKENWTTVLAGFIVPALVGNIIGGVMLVAILNHAQVVAGGGGEDL
jgi:formate/nitrite transporter FocA (FNT family)